MRSECNLPTDLFSGHAKEYSIFRPSYPQSLYTWLIDQAEEKNLAWDCACGNGQVAADLAKSFAKVVATDISREQLANRVSTADNIEYLCAPAEDSPLAPNSVDLIVVAQAFHWIEQQAFFREVESVLKPGGVLAVWSYAFCLENPVTNCVNNFAKSTLKECWNEQSLMVWNNYLGVKFPYSRVASPQFRLEKYFTKEQYLGYLSTWSAVAKFKEIHQHDPLIELAKKIDLLWPESDTKKLFVWDLNSHFHRKEI